MAVLTHAPRRAALFITSLLSLTACAASHEAKPEARPQALALDSASSDPKLVWVMMKDQAELEHARSVSDWAARGTAVRDALLETAHSKQDSIQRYLLARASNFESFWIVNALRVHADAETIEQLKSRPDVAQVSAERVYSIPQPQPAAADGVSDSALEWGLASIRAQEAWQTFGTHGEGIVLGSIDTGVQFDHPALVRQYRGNQNGSFDHNYNWFDPSHVCGKPSLAPCDNTAHGTHTMGTMVGLDESGEHQIGVAPGARWIAAKGCESNSCTTAALLSSAQWMLAPTDLNNQNPRPELRPNIVSNSWGSVPGDTYLRGVVQAWVAAGMFPVFAAGNNGPACGSTYSPGDFPESYSVAAYDQYDNIAEFSGRGSGSVGASKPNIAAPGVNVTSSVVGNGYLGFSGTSMATPHVAGAVALLWSAVPELLGDVSATRALLDKTAVDMGDWNCGGDKTNNATWGEGRLDVYAALQNAKPQSVRGQLLGQVTSDAKPLAKASVYARAAGQNDHFILTNDDGSYQLALPVGTYSIEVRAFGYATQTLAQVVISDNSKQQRSMVLEPLPRTSITGTVVDDLGAAVPYVTVSANGVPIAPVYADLNGHYTLRDIPQGDYILSFDANGCYERAQQHVTASASPRLDVTLARHFDSYGYGCRVLGEKHVSIDQPLITAGDDESRVFDLPFPFVYYGKEYEKVSVSINGALSFQPKPFVFANAAIPSPTPPNAAIYGLWHDYVVDGSSTVFAQVVGAAPRRLAVFEWRNVHVSPYENIDQRFNFAILLHETGEITMQYGESGAAKRYGELSSIGIEDENGTDGLLVSLYRASVVPGMSIRYAVPDTSILRGTITDENDGLPIAGAQLAATSGDQRHVRKATSDQQGKYVLLAPKQTAQVVVNAKNYTRQTRALNLNPSRDTHLNLALQTAAVALDRNPKAIELIVPKDKSRTREFILQNKGSAPLVWSFQQEAPNQHSPGQVITSFNPGLQVPWGVGIADGLWVSDLYGLRNVEFNNDGKATGRAWPAEWPYVSLDMAYDTRHKLMCQVDLGAGYAIGLPCWDPTSGKVETSITGNYAWTSVSQRGLAYDSSDDTFYIGGPDLGTIFHIAGLSHDQPGEIISQCQPPDPRIFGLAWNASKRVLWQSTNSELDTLFALNPADCSVLSALPHPAPGNNGAGLEVDEHGDLWMVATNLGSVYLVASGIATFSSVPWLSATPDSSTLSKGASSTVTLTVNSSDLEAGVYDAALYLESDAARAPSVRVPVRLIVTDYQRALDSGSDHAYTDSQLETWSADRQYVSGAWGYVGESSVWSSEQPVAGTDDPLLYQNLRLNASGYRFDNVPNGVYAVELRFAQPSELEGQHEFDVIIEDEVVLPAYDPAYDNGADHADERTFYVSVSDGQLDIRFAPRVGQPFIDALRVTHRPDR